MTENNQRDEEVDPRLLNLLERLRQVPERDPGAAARGRERFLSEAKSLSRPISASPLHSSNGGIKVRQEKQRLSRNIQLFWSSHVAVILAVVAVVLGVTLVTGTGIWSGATSEKEDDSEVEFIGTVEAIGDKAWIISGQLVAITPDTRIEAGISIDDEIEVEVLIHDDGLLTGLDLESEVNEEESDDDDDS